MDAIILMKIMIEKMPLVEMKQDMLTRSVKEGFSGGEKKKTEILQLAMLKPGFAILDETDSGLDIDALRVVSDGINSLPKKESGKLLITHYKRLLDYVKPDRILILVDGNIVHSGGSELANKLEEKGYDWIKEK